MKLVFGSLTLGAISQPLYCDQTWFGVLILDPSVENEKTGRRILAYKNFCEDWTERSYQNPDSPPDAGEFDQYLDLAESADWWILDDDGTSYHVGCPVFHRSGDFSCRSWEFTHPKK